jgi:uncharacterized protein (UPF0297 family)
MKYNAVTDYGLVLNDDTIKVIASKVFDDCDKNESAYDLGYRLYEQGICEYISEFTGEAEELMDDGRFYWGCEYEDYNADYIFYIPLFCYPTLFNKAYNDMDEIIGELKSKVGEYLPDDFDYRKNIRHICGTYYG